MKTSKSMGLKINGINPIFTADKVQQELNAQIQITQAFDQAQQQTRIAINRKVSRNNWGQTTINYNLLIINE